MQATEADQSRLLSIIVDHLDVPKSYYEKAATRHRSLGEWLHRKESAVAAYDPDVRPQGSFRYGTVIRPINEGDAYDLDNVCLLRKLSKSILTQERLKELYGDEVKAYAKANGMLAPVTEHNRCWRLNYADEIEFHLDTLPCVPEEASIVQRLILAGIPAELARRTIAITDKRHPQYREITSVWHSSNPRGFAAWFEQRAALGRVRSTTFNEARAAVEDVPPYEWKTALQRAIQILKRHRDVMFKTQSDLAPISMIITNLAAHAYGGETDLLMALRNIVAKMPEFVRGTFPRVPNPADPAEDYAEKWAKDPRLEKCFWEWHAAVKADLNRIPHLLQRTSLKSDVRSLFLVELTNDEERIFNSVSSRPSVPAVFVPPVISIPTATKPWGTDA
jgi:hypothetical protein